MDWSVLWHFLNFVGTSLVALFVIIDPFSVIPIYASLTEAYTPEERRSARIKSVTIGGVIIATFALSGMGIFNLFGITLPAFQIAGGILLLFLGIEQLGANQTRVKEEERIEGMERDDIAVFPLATPLIAGPGAISTVILLASKATSSLDLFGLVIAIFLTMLLSYLVLATSPFLLRLLGKTGLNLLTRIMAIILTAISIQFILNGISGFWVTLAK